MRRPASGGRRVGGLVAQPSAPHGRTLKLGGAGIVRLCLLTAQRKQKVAAMRHVDIVDDVGASRKPREKRMPAATSCCLSSRST